MHNHTSIISMNILIYFYNGIKDKYSSWQWWHFHLWHSQNHSIALNFSHFTFQTSVPNNRPIPIQSASSTVCQQCNYNLATVYSTIWSGPSFLKGSHLLLPVTNSTTISICSIWYPDQKQRLHSGESFDLLLLLEAFESATMVYVGSKKRQINMTHTAHFVEISISFIRPHHVKDR